MVNSKPDSFLEGFLALYERLTNLSLVNLTFRTTMESTKKDKSTRVYFEWLNNNIEYQNWLKACPYQFIDFREKSDKSIQIKFKNAHLFD